MSDEVGLSASLREWLMNILTVGAIMALNMTDFGGMVGEFVAPAHMFWALSYIWAYKGLTGTGNILKIGRWYHVAVLVRNFSFLMDSFIRFYYRPLFAYRGEVTTFGYGFLFFGLFHFFDIMDWIKDYVMSGVDRF